MVKTSLLDSRGELLTLNLKNIATGNNKTKILHLEKDEQTFQFEGIEEKPIPDLLQGFSAPVKLNFDYSDEQLAFLLKHSKDEFNRWDAGNRLALKVLLESIANYSLDRNSESVSTLCQALAFALQSNEINQSLLAEFLILPNEKDMDPTR